MHFEQFSLAARQSRHHQEDFLDLSGFQKLPLEIQEKIFGFLISPRDVVIKLEENDFPFAPDTTRSFVVDSDTEMAAEEYDEYYNEQLQVFEVSNTSHSITSPTPLPIISQICAVSRAIFLRDYFPRVGKDGQIIYINGNIDRVCIKSFGYPITQGYCKELEEMFKPATQQLEDGSTISPSQKRSRDIKSVVIHRDPIWFLMNDVDSKDLQRVHWLDWFPVADDMQVVSDNGKMRFPWKKQGREVETPDGQVWINGSVVWDFGGQYWDGTSGPISGWHLLG